MYTKLLSSGLIDFHLFDLQIIILILVTKLACTRKQGVGTSQKKLPCVGKPKCYNGYVF